MEPSITSAVIILHAWNQKEWTPYIDKYRLLHQYPAGRLGLFTTPDPNDSGKRIEIGPTKFPVNVWLADTTSKADDIRSATASTSGRTHIDAQVHFEDVPEETDEPVMVANVTHQQSKHELIFARVWHNR